MELTSNEKIILEFAIAAYGRVLNISGIKHYSSLLDTQVLSQDAILNEFMTNNEAALRYQDTASDSDTVKQVFNNVLNREPATEEGLAFWVDRLSSGNITLTTLVEEVLDSARNAQGGDKAQLDNKMSLSTSYLDLLTNYPNYTLTSPDLSKVTSDISSVTDLETILNAQIFSSSTNISTVTILSGNYSFGGIVDITVSFDNEIILDGVDSSLSILVGDIVKKADFSSKTSNTLTYKYTVEDGYGSEEVTISTIDNGITLNSSILQDTQNKVIKLSYIGALNEAAIIKDVYAPVFTIDNLHYDTKTNNLNIYGEGFSSLLENTENFSTDIAERIDFTKLIWDIDSDDALAALLSIVAFGSDDASSAHVLDNNNLSIIISSASTLEETLNFGHNNGVAIDSIDISTGFLVDVTGNASIVTSQNDVILGIDNQTWGSIGDDTIHGNTNSDTINANDGNDTIYAKAGNDAIDAGGGDDTIVAGTGVDILKGGTGNDIFVFSIGDSVPLFTEVVGIDKITDLSFSDTNGDTIDLDIVVESINSTLNGNVNEDTFINDINLLRSQDLSAGFVIVEGGDLIGHIYLIADYNDNNTFDVNDFIVDITGTTATTLTSLSTSTFI